MNNPNKLQENAGAILFTSWLLKNSFKNRAREARMKNTKLESRTNDALNIFYPWLALMKNIIKGEKSEE